MDRAQIFTTLSALVSGDFEKLLFAANPPRGLIPGPTAAQAMRVSALLDWADSPTGCGLDEIQDLLSQLDNLPPPPKLCPHNLPRSGTKTFVGRQKDLDRVHAQLTETSRLAITALKGMGGIGKTELALQYAYTHLDAETYPGGICWLLAKDQNIGTEIVNFARTRLNVTPPDGLDLAAQVAYVWNQWPTSGDVLVIIDDVAGQNENEAYAAIKPYLPTDSRFRVLLTTRLQLGASIPTVSIDVLSEVESLKLLESLIGQERLTREPNTAKALCKWLGYLPLGLELVGRFLHTKPTWNLAKMQQQLEAKKLEAKALCQAQADMTAAHESLAAAFELSWQDLKPPAQDLAYRLGLYALAPIPWEWMEEWYDGTDPDDLEDWRDEELISRSLLDLDAAANTVQLHQLIREFFLAKLETWTEADPLKRQYCQRMVAIAQTIPQTPTRDQILAVTPAIPHIAEAATTWQGWLSEEDNGLIWPFIGLGRFYAGQGAYGQAEPWYANCLVVARDRLGDDHPHVANSLNNLAHLYQSQGQYSLAEPLYQEALALTKQLLGEAHPDVANSLHNLAGLYESQGRYSLAEPLYQKALALRKQLFGEVHPAVANSLNNLANLYQRQGNYSLAEPLYQEALALRKQLLGEAHPAVASSLNNLAHLYDSQRRYSLAEPLYQKALALIKHLLGEAHPTVATSLNNLALLYKSQGRYGEAEPLYLQAMKIDGEHPSLELSIIAYRAKTPLR
jgi:tetratricopeptide (TPR) repeat protein